MLLLVDLDNTLVDRAAAFNAWARSFIGTLGGPATDAEWLIDADQDGYESRDSLAHAIGQRFETAPDTGEIRHMLLFDHVPLMTLDQSVTSALGNAREAGWKIGIVTNGATKQQTLKIRRLGLEAFVDAVIISEAVGVKKPDPEIFRIATASLGATGATGVTGWMVGDHPTADIAGGRRAGLKTAWVSRGKTWAGDTGSLGLAAPDLVAPTAAEAINAVVCGQQV
ncbi:HAD family hydrolase [Paenarthrobacter nicotinovorans]|uniref:HAD family hydrolase n=1 Tax=Paenarthrobacter nicotinovorans TaxID=29320 RepID=UPI001642E73E|nr:HAD family hydrolase [Paenarthrobacter nicotinovorans]